MSADPRRRPQGFERRERTANDRPDAIHVPPAAALRHRLRDLVQRTGDLTMATELGIPRSRAVGWLLAAPTVRAARAGVSSARWDGTRDRPRQPEGRRPHPRH